MEIGHLCFAKEINPCHARSFSDGSRALFAGLSTLSSIMQTVFFEGNQIKICPARKELAFIVLRLYVFPSTDFSGLYVKTFQHG